MLNACPTFLASAQPLVGGGIGFSWWQAIGGTLAVFALLLICLKLLGRVHGQGKQAEAAVITVWPLGPKREIQIIRLRDEVHYVYRHESGLVVLERESYADFRAAHPAPAAGAGGPLPSLTAKIAGFLGARNPHHRAVLNGNLPSEDSPLT